MQDPIDELRNSLRQLRGELRTDSDGGDGDGHQHNVRAMGRPADRPEHCQGLDGREMVSVFPRDELAERSSVVEGHSTGRLPVQHRVQQQNLAASLQGIRLTQEIGAAEQQIDVLRQARISGQALHEVTTDAVVTGERVSQAYDEPRLHPLVPTVAAYLGAPGSLMVKVVPLPTSLSTWMVPRCFVTMPYAMDRPRPVPSPAGFVL